MTSPPKRPIISLKFKTPDPARGDLKPAAPATPQRPASVNPSPPAAGPASTLPPSSYPTMARPQPLKTQTFTPQSVKPASGKTASAKPQSLAQKPAKPQAASPPDVKPQAAKKTGPSISPDLFKAAIKAAGLAIQNVVADPQWKSEELFNDYQAAKERASPTQKHQAKLVSTVATRRHGKNIEQADVESAAMRAAYAAALVALVDHSDQDQGGASGEP